MQNKRQLAGKYEATLGRDGICFPDTSRRFILLQEDKASSIEIWNRLSQIRGGFNFLINSKAGCMLLNLRQLGRVTNPWDIPRLSFHYCEGNFLTLMLTLAATTTLYIDCHFSPIWITERTWIIARLFVISIHHLLFILCYFYGIELIFVSNSR